MTTDNGARALSELLRDVDPDAGGMEPLGYFDRWADAILANGAAFLPDAAELDRLRAALRDANQIIAMTRQHLQADHPDCAYTALGIMNDADRARLTYGPDEHWHRDRAESEGSARYGG